MAKKLGQKAAANGVGGGTALAEPEKKTRRPRQKLLNDDPAFTHIKEIENLASEYVEARDRRQALLADEVDLKEKLMDAMKKHKLETYSFSGYMVFIEHEQETVKVRKKRASEESPKAT